MAFTIDRIYVRSGNNKVWIRCSEPVEGFATGDIQVLFDNGGGASALVNSAVSGNGTSEIQVTTSRTFLPSDVGKLESSISAGVFTAVSDAAGNPEVTKQPTDVIRAPFRDGGISQCDMVWDTAAGDIKIKVVTNSGEAPSSAEVKVYGPTFPGRELVLTLDETDFSYTGPRGSDYEFEASWDGGTIGNVYACEITSWVVADPFPAEQAIGEWAACYIPKKETSPRIILAYETRPFIGPDGDDWPRVLRDAFPSVEFVTGRIITGRASEGATSEYVNSTAMALADGRVYEIGTILKYFLSEDEDAMNPSDPDEVSLAKIDDFMDNGFPDPEDELLWDWEPGSIVLLADSTYSSSEKIRFLYDWRKIKEYHQLRDPSRGPCPSYSTISTLYGRSDTNGGANKVAPWIIQNKPDEYVDSDPLFGERDFYASDRTRAAIAEAAQNNLNFMLAAHGMGETEWAFASLSLAHYPDARALEPGDFRLEGSSAEGVAAGVKLWTDGVDWFTEATPTGVRKAVWINRFVLSMNSGGVLETAPEGFGSSTYISLDMMYRMVRHCVENGDIDDIIMYAYNNPMNLDSKVDVIEFASPTMRQQLMTACSAILGRARSKFSSPSVGRGGVGLGSAWSLE